MISEPVLMILAGIWSLTCGGCIVMSLRHRLDGKASLRRCAEAQSMASIEIATMLALKAAPEGVKPGTNKLTKKIVPLRPDSA